MAVANASVDVDQLENEVIEIGDADDAPGSSTTDAEIVETSTNGTDRDDDAPLTAMQFDPPLAPLHQDLSTPFSDSGEILQPRAVRRNGLAVIVPPTQNRWEFKVFQEDDDVEEILEEYDDAGFIEYLVLFSDGSEDVVSVP